MDRQEYLQFIAILEDVQASIEYALRDVSPNADDALALHLNRVVDDLKRAIQAYQDKTRA